MENHNIATDVKTEDFDFKKHFVNALIGALYYYFCLHTNNVTF